MRTTLQVTTQPAAEPVALEIVKRHCRIDHASDDGLIKEYIRAARVMAENYLSRALVTQTLLWTVLPEGAVRPSMHFLRGPLELPRAPVRAITSPTADPATGIGVVVLDERGNATTIAPAMLPIVPPATMQGYVADLMLDPARLTIGLATPLVDGRTLRDVQLRHLQVQFLAGYGAPAQNDPLVAAIPGPIKQAIMLTVAHLYEHRGDADAEMPRSADWLLDPFRIQWVA
jgi:uncharacterized phiE125 gp8 family phage protein